jgi:hypothetical protein
MTGQQRHSDFRTTAAGDTLTASYTIASFAQNRNRQQRQRYRRGIT